MTPIDAEWFKRRKDTKEGGKGENYDFDVGILEDGALEKALSVKKKTLDGGKTLKTIYEVIYVKYFNESRVEFY